LNRNPRRSMELRVSKDFYFSEVECTLDSGWRVHCSRKKGTSLNKGSIWVVWVFLPSAPGSLHRGLPRGRRLYSKFRAFTVSIVHPDVPFGRSRRTDSRMATRSMSPVNALMPSNQSVPRGIVPDSSGTGDGADAESRRRLDHDHFSARPTSPACNGLRSI
jgi:hypothetical protein